MKLWLDDVRPPPDSTWVWIKTFDGAVELLKSNKIKEISFDHDLGTELTGYDLACWIECRAHFWLIHKMKWEIHSENPVGASNIKAAMEKADMWWEGERQCTS